MDAVGAGWADVNTTAMWPGGTLRDTTHKREKKENSTSPVRAGTVSTSRSTPATGASSATVLTCCGLLCALVLCRRRPAQARPDLQLLLRPRRERGERIRVLRGGKRRERKGTGGGGMHLCQYLSSARKDTATAQSTCCLWRTGSRAGTRSTAGCPSGPRNPTRCPADRKSRTHCGWWSDGYGEARDSSAATDSSDPPGARGGGLCFTAAAAAAAGAVAAGAVAAEEDEEECVGCCC